MFKGGDVKCHAANHQCDIFTIVTTFFKVLSAWYSYTGRAVGLPLKKAIYTNLWVVFFEVEVSFDTAERGLTGPLPH
jgi:hypothetical protein